MTTSWAKNARIIASGYSPSQWVLGRSMRMPWSLLDRAGQLAEQSRAVSEPHFSSRLGMLTAARKAFEHLDTSQRLRKAWLARSRLTPSSQHLLPGTTVYIYRKVKPRKGVKLPLLKAEWHGPATVIGHDGSCIWCSFRGTCTKVAAEHVRRASPEEMLAFHALPREDKALLDQLFRGEAPLDYQDFTEVEEQKGLHAPPLSLLPREAVGERQHVSTDGRPGGSTPEAAREASKPPSRPSLARSPRMAPTAPRSPNPKSLNLWDEEVNDIPVPDTSPKPEGWVPPDVRYPPEGWKPLDYTQMPGYTGTSSASGYAPIRGGGGARREDPYPTNVEASNAEGEEADNEE